MTTKGELVLYFFPWEGYWDEMRINIFYAIYKYYLLRCRTRKQLPTSFHFETTLKFKKIIMTNPTNSDLTKNLLPLWTGRELTRAETLELPPEVEGKTDKGRMFKYSNKNTLLLKTKVMDNFRFPILSKDYINNRLNEIKKSDKIRERLIS
jgi:hypothetical protein